MHGEAVRPTKLARGSGATGSHQVLPGGLAEPRASEWASLGVLGTKTLSSHELADLARMWAKPPRPEGPHFHPLMVPSWWHDGLFIDKHCVKINFTFFSFLHACSYFVLNIFTDVGCIDRLKDILSNSCFMDFVAI